jgi:ribosomal protein S18 acetylase RimI-like enzyme
MRLAVMTAGVADAVEIAALRNRVAEDMTAHYGKGLWSHQMTERGALYQLRQSQVVMARRGKRIVGILCLTKKKPWAIDVSYFTAVKRPVYLIGMAVDPKLQRQGVGRRLAEAAGEIARKGGFEAIRLDAFDSAAGAEGFYAKCGYCETGRASYRASRLVYFEMLLGD